MAQLLDSKRMKEAAERITKAENRILKVKAIIKAGDSRTKTEDLIYKAKCRIFEANALITNNPKDQASTEKNLVKAGDHVGEAEYLITIAEKIIARANDLIGQANKLLIGKSEDPSTGTEKSGTEDLFAETEGRFNKAKYLITRAKDLITKAEDPITIAEVEEIAKRNIDPDWYNYYAGGADEERTLRRNTEAWNLLQILPRVLKDVSEIDTSVTIFGRKWPIPLAFSPSGQQRMAGFEGEVDAARAAGKFGTNMVLSSASTSKMEDVIHGGNSNSEFWFQLYFRDDHDHNVQRIKQAKNAGFKALVITVDAPVLGNRIKERKVPVVLPPGIKMQIVDNSETDDPNKKREPTTDRRLMDARTAEQAKEIRDGAQGRLNSAKISWDYIKGLHDVAQGMKIILKGIMTPEDAKLAVENKVDGIIVSNHGGRQFDCTVATIEALPAVVKAVNKRIPVLIDGGIRHGSDILKAVALGADAVLIGRPVLWGIAYDGQVGVETVLNIFEREFSRAMALTGVTKVADLNASYLGARTGGFGVTEVSHWPAKL